MNKCPKCGGTSGWYTKGEVWQYYTSNGDPNGYEIVSEGRMATCLDCGKQIKLTKILCGVESVKRKTAQKPVSDGGRYLCPVCRDNKSLLGLYCDNCGQAIDWEV